MKPWRSIAVPHKDVLEGTFQQSEFAADISAVRVGKATHEYQDPVAFFERTFITAGMRLLLTQVATRLAGKGGEPVIQLQTAFGGGKTHTMLAVYHLATRSCPLSDLAGVPGLIKQAGLMDVPQAKVAVLDGTDMGPNQPRKHGKQTVNTLWGEMAWQLGGDEGLALVKEADVSGTSPGKEILCNLLTRSAPCVVLIDEMVAYVRQFSDGQALAGGTYESNMSFVQSLTEAAKQVPNALVLCSLPESMNQAGGPRGKQALDGLEAIFQRVQALWKPVEIEEAFEIVRRRLFENIRDSAGRDVVCRAFADLYVAEGAKLPGETQESHYYDRLVQAYPIHPEVFDRLYEDWTTIEGFQRTRGVLKLMAKVIFRLWQDDNTDLVILPGSLPLGDGTVRTELTYHLPPGWDPVIDKDIDGERAETTELEKREPRFGQVGAARRIARTLFLGTAPSSVSTKPGIRGLDRARALLGCLQPGQGSAVYVDALNRLADRLHYLNSSGDKVQDATRYWFDTRANLRREMEDRKRRFDDIRDVQIRIAEALKRAVGHVGGFDGSHIFTAHSDIPDDAALRLVVLAPEAAHSRENDSCSKPNVLEYVRQNGAKPRYRANRLIFLAADSGVLPRLRDATRAVLAWHSIVDDINQTRLIVDMLQKKQAEKELATAEEILPRIARECYKWLLCPVQHIPTDPDPSVEAFPLNTSGGTLATELERVCVENELVITTWSPIHLRGALQALYWKPDQPNAGAMAFWEDTLRYLYLPRLKHRDVLAAAVRTGATSRDFFACAYGKSEGKYEGFSFGQAILQFDDTLLLIEPTAAAAYDLAHKPKPPDHIADSGSGEPAMPGRPGAAMMPPRTGTISPTPSRGNSTVPPVALLKARSFHGSAEITAATAKMHMVNLAEEIIAVLCQDPKARVKVTVEISAEFPDGASDQMKRAITENANQLGLKTKVWE